MAKRTRSVAQMAAEARYNARRCARPAIPRIELTTEEAQWVDEVFARYGTKKEAVLAGLKALHGRKQRGA